jgi:hypothetical protein
LGGNRKNLLVKSKKRKAKKTWKEGKEEKVNEKGENYA